jgi:hypothetical protein
MITFGICVVDKLQALGAIDSIIGMQFMPEDYEIIVIGDKDVLPNLEYVKRIEFDETVKKGWITRKKNIIVENARFDYVCLIHDYYRFDYRWYVEAVEAYRKNMIIDVLQAKIYTKEGHRHSDWIVNPRHMDKYLEQYPHHASFLMRVAPHENGPRYVCGLPYNTTGLEHIQYISGGYIFARKNVLQHAPMNEEMVWGDAEDLEWSERVISLGYKFRMEEGMMMRLAKPNKWRVYEMPPESVDALKRIYE